MAFRKKWGQTSLSQGAEVPNKTAKPVAAWTERSVPVFFLLLTGCAYVSPVLPPLLDTPLQVPYINAVEYGDKIIVEFTLPELTTEGNPLRNVRSLEVRVGPGVTPMSTDAWAAAAKAYPVPSPVPGPFTREIPAVDWIGKEVLISARAIGPKGKPAQWATLKLLKVDPALAKPTAVKADNVEQGVKVHWQGAAGKYRVYRSAPGATPERLGESDRAEYLDSSTQYDTAYEYRVQAITDDAHGSEVSDPDKITPEDKFPPSVPGALTAILGVNTVELAWTRNTEADFRGYNVYRSTDGGALVKIAELIAAPSYSDNKIEAGKKYRYEVTAVDAKGNESAHSTPAEASAQ